MRILLFLLFSYTSAQAQIITGTYDFEADPEKKYALYIPSTYDATVPSKVIVGLHPWNTSKWDAESWAEELSELAEANNTIVICPDGGTDGQIDDDIDTSFTTFLIDQVANEYTLDANNMYLVGFSWGGRTVYSYGLSNKSKFAGFMPIGAAVELSVVSSLINNVKDLPFYIIHGSQDNPNVRFYPLRDALVEAEACVETDFLEGVGHTIEFPDQLEILNAGFQWLINNSCSSTSSIFVSEAPVLIKQTVYGQGESIRLLADKTYSYEVYNMTGTKVLNGTGKEIFADLIPGNYVINVVNNRSYRILVS